MLLLSYWNTQDATSGDLSNTFVHLKPTTSDAARNSTLSARGFPYPMTKDKEFDHRVSAVILTMIHYINSKLP